VASSVYSCPYDRYDGPSENRTMMMEYDEVDVETLLQTRRVRKLREFINSRRCDQRELDRREATARCKILGLGIGLGVVIFLVILGLAVKAALKRG